MELKTVNGKVKYLMNAGKDKVSGEMTHKEALDLIKNGKVEEKNGQIIVNDKFIFGELKDEPEEEPKAEEPTAEPKEDEAPKKKSKPRRTRRAKK